MQILTNNQVKYCNLEIKTGENIECVPGIYFQDKLFVKSKFFLTEHKLEAIEYTKQKYLASKGNKAYIVLEDVTGLTVWIEDKSAKIKEEENPIAIINAVNLENLVSQMRSIGGVKIKDRKYKLKSYKQCFLGSEACNYFMEHLNLSAKQAIYLGQRLIDEHWIHHVVDQQPFKNDFLFYRFYWDED